MAKPKTKEDDIPKSVLQNVLTGRQPTRMLLSDRAFQLRAQQICKQIKRSADCDDLIADVNLRVLQSGSTLKRAKLKNENQFFRWFIAVAKNLHRRSTMKSCNEKARHWPNSTAYLSAVELDGFFAHADVCPYHRAILEAEETEQDQKFASMLKSVRGLDAHGRILGLQHLRATVADLKRRMAAMRNGKALADGFPFQSIGVYNDGRRIALASSSFDPLTHRCTHQLNPLAGLQIRGITGPKPEDYVPLGFYPLDGVRHLDTEHHLHLPNGYTVGLSIEQHSETSFTVGFKCVKSEAMKQAKARTAWDKQASREVVRAGIIPAFIANAIAGVKHHPIRYANAAAVAILLTLLLLPAFRSPQSGGAGTKPVDSVQVAQDSSPSLQRSEQQNEQTPAGDPRNRPHLRPAHVSNHARLLIDTQIGTAGSNLDLLPRTPATAHEVENRPKGKQVEETTTWVLQMYETGPHTTERLVVTHYADSERLKDELENLVPDSSLRLVLVTDPEQSAQRPNTGNEVYWKTNYQNEKIASVEATVFRRDSGDPTVPSIKQSCSVVGCDDWMLIANAISNVYEIINRDWKPPVIFAAGKMSRCWFGGSSPVLQNGFANTGVSGGEFDELDLCAASADKGTH